MITRRVDARRDRDLALVLADLRQQRAIAVDATKTAAQRKNARQAVAADRLLLQLYNALPIADSNDAGEV
jgi:hypothetical protein